MNSHMIDKATKFASAAHNGHKRKYTGDPYTVHLFAVAKMVKDHGLSNHAICAAILHDTVEDTLITHHDIKMAFGGRVSDLVKMLTDVSTPNDGNRATRKAMDASHLSHSDSVGASIKLADLIDNSRSIVDHDPKFAKVFLAEKAALLKVLTHGNADLHALATKTLADGLAKIKA